MKTYTVLHHLPPAGNEPGQLTVSHIEADHYKTSRDGNSVTFYRNATNTDSRFNTGGTREEKHAFVNRVCSILISDREDLHDHSKPTSDQGFASESTGEDAFRADV